MDRMDIKRKHHKGTTIFQVGKDFFPKHPPSPLQPNNSPKNLSQRSNHDFIIDKTTKNRNFRTHICSNKKIDKYIVSQNNKNQYIAKSIKYVRKSNDAKSNLTRAYNLKFKP